MREISQLHLPIKRPEDVIPYLGSPGHWRDGRSAKLIAESWFAADGLPEMVRVTLGRCPPDQVSRFAGAELVDAFLERCTELGDGSTTAHQNTHLSMLLKRRDFADWGAIPWGILGSVALVRR
jgi:hypothetical protein